MFGRGPGDYEGEGAMWPQGDSTLAAGDPVGGVVEAPDPAGFSERLKRFFDLISGRAKRWRGQAMLIESLSQIAGGVSMKSTHGEVLEMLVEEAKYLTATDKVVLVLFDERNPGVEGATVVAKGKRSQFPEAWWRQHVERIAEEVLYSCSPRTVRDETGSIICVPVMVKNRRLGLLLAIDPRAGSFSRSKQSLMAVLGAFAGAAIENAHLLSKSQHALLEEERARIAKEMHDGLSQTLFGISLDLESCRKDLFRDPQGTDVRLKEIQTMVMQSQAELRRYIYDLRPVSLYRLGLAGSVNVFLKRMATTSHFEPRLYVQGTERPMMPATEACLYRVAIEAITNAAKHASAGTVTVLLSYDDDHMDMTIEDDGQGFDVRSAMSEADDGDSIGLRSMQDRVSDEGGQVRIASSAMGGTLVRVRVPC